MKSTLKVGDWVRINYDQYPEWPYWANKGNICNRDGKISKIVLDYCGTGPAAILKFSSKDKNNIHFPLKCFIKINGMSFSRIETTENLLNL